MKIRTAITIGLLAVILFSAYTWYRADRWENIVTSGDGWYEYPELSYMSVRDEYDQAFKKIVLVNGIFFASSFLLLKLSEKRNS